MFIRFVSPINDVAGSAIWTLCSVFYVVVRILITCNMRFEAKPMAPECAVVADCLWLFVCGYLSGI